MITHIIQSWTKGKGWEEIRTAKNESEALDKVSELERNFENNMVKFRILPVESADNIKKMEKKNAREKETEEHKKLQSHE